MIDEDEIRHRLEHRHIDALPAAGDVAVAQRREDGVDGKQTDDAVGDRQRHVARRPIAGFGEQRRNATSALDQIVVSRPRRIRPVLPIAEHAGVNDRGIAGGDVLVGKAETRHRLRPHIIDEHVGIRRQAQQHVAAGRLLEIERDAPFVAVHIEEHRPHSGVPARADLAHDVAFERLDFDDVRAHVAELQGRIGTHEHGRHIQDAQTTEWAHSAFPPLMRVALVHILDIKIHISEQVKARNLDQHRALGEWKRFRKRQAFGVPAIHSPGSLIQ